MAGFVKPVRLHRVVEIRRPRGKILKIKVQEPNGKTKTWSVDEAIDGMVQGTDAFFVCPPDSELWSPVTPMPYKKPKFIKTKKDTTKKDILLHLPRF